jgi:MFS family permease
MILPLLGGLLVSQLGNRSVYFIVGVFLCIGQFLFAIGCSNKDIYLMLIGRTLFGVGGETINITQNCMLVKWFKKEELSFPFGLLITVSRLGSILNDVASPQIASVSFVALFICKIL